jgi:hypothetical protein
LAFNFNYSDSKEYEMFGNMVDEEINLYGLSVRYFKTDRINIDRIFGENSHMKVNKDYWDINVKLEQDSFDMGGDIFNKFGVMSLATLNLYISAKTMEIIHPELYDGKGYDGIYGNLIKLPNGKFMEVTNFEDEVEGYNNLFVYADTKKIFKLTVKTYSQNRDELDGLEEEVEKLDLEKAFNIADEQNVEQNVATTTTKKKIIENEEDGKGKQGAVEYDVNTTKKPIVVKKNPFGDLG